MALIINFELVNYNLQEVDTVHNIQCTYIYEEAHYNIMCTSIMVMTHLSFFVEFLFPSFGQVSLHISKLVEGSHQVTTVLISGKECWFLVSGQLCVYSLFKEAIVRSDSLHQFHERSVGKKLFTSVLEKYKEYVNAYICTSLANIIAIICNIFSGCKNIRQKHIKAEPLSKNKVSFFSHK